MTDKKKKVKKGFKPPKSPSQRKEYNRQYNLSMNKGRKTPSSLGSTKKKKTRQKKG